MLLSILSAVIYGAFVSLGLHDAIPGSAWPVMDTAIAVPVSRCGYPPVPQQSARGLTQPHKYLQMTAHLDFAVEDKERKRLAVARALACGAKMTDAQYGSDRRTTLTDPAGHLFCFMIW